MTPLATFLTVFLLAAIPYATEQAAVYPQHDNITATVFWIGEEATGENEYIPNKKSVWDDRWMEHFGGIDDPGHRNGYFPAKFKPKENPFYIALPYNDFTGGKRKPDASKHVYWAGAKEWKDGESMCKNRWVKIVKGEKTAFAQWEDAGHYSEDDHEYVFGTAPPKNPRANKAAIDVSPAVASYLGLKGEDKVSWQFVDDQDVPDGPWKETVTTSHIYWD